MMQSTTPDANQLVILDAATIAAVSAAICLWSRNLVLMTVLVPLLILVRMRLLSRVGQGGVNMKAEWIFMIFCTILGAFNDWNSVDRHKIYSYSVPHFFSFSTIPVWMLLYWGMILRLFARLARWERLGPPSCLSNRVGTETYSIESAPLRVAALLVLVFTTRQAIYRFSSHPILSWLPFFAALAAYWFFFFPTRHDFRLALVFLIGGPAIEIIYIQVAGLHKYSLGWIAGVPAWIVLWWLLAILVWKDIAGRFEDMLKKIFSPASQVSR